MSLKNKILLVVISVFFEVICLFIMEINSINEDYCKHMNEKGKYAIHDKYELYSVSAYTINLGGPVSIKECVYKVGWNDDYVVVLQYDLDEDGKPDKSEPHYYIIEVETDNLIGPLTKEEYKEYPCSKIRMRYANNYIR